MAFQKDSLGWQLQQLTQRINEWVEARWGQDNGGQDTLTDLPQWRIPEWLLTGLGWALLGGLLGWWLWKALPTFKRLWFQFLRPGVGRSLSPAPQKPHPSLQQWLLQSQTLARQENYPEACRALYFALLEWLHEQAVIPQSASRTDGEYVHLLPQTLSTANQIDAAAIVISLHQQLCFSDRTLNQQDFLTCQKAIQNLSL